MRRRLIVDPVACDGFGHCAELAPELIALDEWGYPYPSATDVSVADLPLAELVVRQCPRNALSVVALDPDGRVTRAANRRS